MAQPIILPSDENKKYNCTQAELYAACGLGWRNLKRNQDAFTNYKALYAPPYADVRITEVQSAKDLPDEQTRDEASESARIVLVDIGNTALGKWQDLKRYISTAYTQPMIKPKLEAAGSDYYRQASDENWEVLGVMMNAGKQFIAAHFDELIANNNMPPVFQNSFSTVKDEFDSAYNRFLEAEETAREGTGAKLSANNNIYEKVISMCEDGQAIFRDIPRKAKLFTFDHLLGLVSSPGAAGIRGTVLDAVTEIPVANATVSIPAQNKSAVTNAQGEYEIERIQSGNITITVTATGYNPKTFTEKVDEGVIHTVDVVIANV